LLHASKSRPVAVELLNSSAWQAAGGEPSVTSGWIIAVGFEEKSATVAWQRQTLLDELRSAPVQNVTDAMDAAGLWSRLTGLQVRPESRYIWKASVLPSKLVEEVRRLAAATTHAHALNGVIWIHREAPVDTAVIRRCPVEAKKSLSVWGKPTPAWELMRTVKQTLDPDDVFNPGRLFGDV
ncbi:MAG TPA: FAD-linked oxidase C-terminal domain-containing protein, partial [Gemmata sp.]|nr:FAD-linked oxidase C-terminal domain-containing protein [Gemmata sp.]